MASVGIVPAGDPQPVFDRGMTVLDLPQSVECGRHPEEILSQFSDGSVASMVLSVLHCIRAGHSQQCGVCPLLEGYQVGD